MGGYPDGSFRPGASVSGKQLAAVMLNLLNYSYDYNDVLKTASKKGLIIEDKDLTRKEAFEAIWTSVSKIKINSLEITLGQKLGKYGDLNNIPLEIVSFGANSNKYLELKFTRSLTEEELANFVYIISYSGKVFPSGFNEWSKDGSSLKIYSTDKANISIGNYVIDIRGVDKTVITKVAVVENKISIPGVATPDPSKTVDKGRLTDFDFKSDSISTESSKKAFIAKYGIGGYATPEMIPSPWNTHPNDLMLGVTAKIDSKTGDVVYTVPKYDLITWTNDMFKLYYKNPPTLVGKDGQAISYKLSKHDFFKWLRDNDDMLYGLGEETIGSPGSSLTLGRELIYLDNRATFEMLDVDYSPYIKYEIDAQLRMSDSFSPSSAVYLKALSNYYFDNKSEADQFYKLFSSYWMGKNGIIWEGTNTKLDTSYKIGERTIRMQNISQDGKTTVFITDKGFNWEHFIDRLGVNQKYYTQDYKIFYPNRNGENR